MSEIFGRLDLIEANSIFLFFLSVVVLFLTVWRIMQRQKNKFYLWAILLYTFLVTTQLFIGIYYDFARPELHGKQSPGDIAAYIFVILEYSIFAVLLSRFIHSATAKSYLLVSCFVFTVAAVFIWHFNSSFYKAISIETTIESISLFPFCLYYFFELLNEAPLLKLTHEPAFWVTSGILFLFICITPYYLVFDYLKNADGMQMIDFIGYDLLVLFLGKATFIKPSLVNG